MTMSPRTFPRLELQDVPRTPASETIRRGSRLVSRKVGLIQQVQQGAYLAQDPAFFTLGVQSADLSRYSDFSNSAESGGAGEAKETALAAAIGESVERYCMHYYDHSAMELAAYREIVEDAVSPDLARLYTREQTERRSGWAYFDEDTTIRWVWGYSLSAQRPRLVPAALVYLGYRAGDGEAAIGDNTSSGLAAACTLEEAILSGLLEIVERDAFTVSWFHRRFGRRIRIDDPELQEMLEKRFSYGHREVDLRIFDLTLDLPIPSAIALMRRPAEFGQAFGMGAAARLDPRAAVRKGLYELGQGLPYLRFLLKEGHDWQPEPDFSNLNNFGKHCLLYNRRPELVSEVLALCDEVEEEVALSEIPDRSTGRVLGDLEYCLKTLREHGWEVIVVDITTPDIRQIGLRVVRVLVPGLMGLHGNHNFPMLGVKRLYEVPRQLAWERSGWDPEAGLNALPHPFP